jgi:hypothetical protein
MKTFWLAFSLTLSFTVPALADSLVRVPLVSRVAPDADVVVPITVTPADSVVSMDLAIDFDPAVVTPTGVYRTAYANSFALSFSLGPSRLDIHMTDVSPLAGDGEVAWVVFRAIGGVGSSSNLVLSASLNGGGIASQVQNGSVSVLSASVHISAPDDAQEDPGTPVMVPISATPFSGVTGIDLAIRVNENVLLATDVEKTALTNALSLVFNLSTPGVVNIALFGSTPITGSGELVRVRYDVVGTNGDKTPLNVSRGDMDEGRLSTLLDDGLFTSCTDADLDADGFSTCAGDCDDANRDIHPETPEVCDGSDNDCDPTTTDGSGEDWYQSACDGPDADQCTEGSSGCLDGAKECTDTTGDDVEVCNDLDDDCDGAIDEGTARVPFYRDADGDGYGDPSSSIIACVAPAGFVATAGDCNDGSPTIHPGVADLCNGVDDDCDPATLDGRAESWYAQPCDGSDADSCAGGGFVCSVANKTCDDGAANDDQCTDFDVNGDTRLDGIELAWWGRAFGLCSDAPATEWWDRIDLNRDGCIDGEELSILGANGVWDQTTVDCTYRCR